MRSTPNGTLASAASATTLPLALLAAVSLLLLGGGPAVSSADPRIAPMAVPDFATLAERVSPAVVSIRTSRTVQASPGMPFPFPFGGQPGPNWGQFGGQFGGSAPREVPSQGSGFVISSDGFIVTNNHVIEGVDTIEVVFIDGQERDAVVVGRDPKTDVALLKVAAEELPYLTLGDSDALRPGEWVAAIGNPFGLENTVTAGIVSAKHRDIGQGSYDDFIQTDAAINPGNSGGPLLNLKGEVVGINTAINPRANTIGFTVPINMAKGILAMLQEDGHVTRGWLGVIIQSITPELAEAFALDDRSGALVSQVVADGPAARGGLRTGDVIVEFAGKRIDEANPLPRIVAEAGVDQTVAVVVLRDGERKKLKVKIGELEEPRLADSRDPGADSSALGLTAQNLTPDLANQLGVDVNSGVLVTAVAPGSPAAAARLQRGDVIVEVDRESVHNVDELRERLAQADDSVLMLISRGDATLFVPMRRTG